MSATSSQARWVYSIGLAAVFLDQLTKYAAEHFLSDGTVVNVIGDLLRFRLAYNEAAAFSLGFGATWILALISSVAVLLLLWYGPKAKTKTWSVIAGLVLGGAAGNWVDRVFKEPDFFSGHVVDFIQIPFNFPIFNLADSFLVIGISFAMLRTLRGDEIGGGRSE
ncbi:MAG: signal peptidase [Actinomycetota bacterium]